MRKTIVLALVVAAFSLAVWNIGNNISLISSAVFEVRPAAAAVPSVGDVIQFGEYDWRVLYVQYNRALIITENIIEKRPFNEQWEAVTWEESTLREYLNSEFLQKFTEEKQGWIADTRIQNPDNLWYEMSGGNDTTDKIFLLSLEEVDRYFGRSGDYENKRRKRFGGRHTLSGQWIWISTDGDDYGGTAFSNANDRVKIAKYNNEDSAWWLRSPGNHSNTAAVVGRDGVVGVFGVSVYDDIGSVCHALWLNL